MESIIDEDGFREGTPYEDIHPYGEGVDEGEEGEGG